VATGKLQKLGLENTSFENVECSIVSTRICMQLSAYSSGIICANLLARCTVIIDYPGNRIAFIPNAKQTCEDGDQS
jgi:hypothetical protein